MKNERQILAELLNKASSGFRLESPLGVDLRTAALAVESMSDETFAAHVDQQEIKKLAQEQETEVQQKSALETEEDQTSDAGAETKNGDMDPMKKANIDWNKYASAVKQNLVRSVLAEDCNVNPDASKERGEGLPEAALPKEQLPNGENNPGLQTDRGEPEAAAKLTPEQTPEIADSLCSNAVEKSEEVKTEETPVEKKASEEEAEESAEEKEAAVEVKEEAEESPAEEESEEESETEVQASIEGEGVELNASLDDLSGPSISEGERTQLDKLFG